MKPELPIEIQNMLPTEIIGLIRRFTPHVDKKQPIHPTLQKQLEKLQRSPLLGKNEMYLKGFEDFILK